MDTSTPRNHENSSKNDTRSLPSSLPQHLWCHHVSQHPPTTHQGPIRARTHRLTRQKLLKAQSNIAIAILIVLLEHVRHAFQDDAALHEQIEAHPPLPALVVGRVQHVDKGRGEPVAEGDERVGELVKGDVAAAVGVEAVEEGAPGGEETPEAATYIPRKKRGNESQ